MTKTFLGLPSVLLSFLAVFTLVSLTSCACDEKHSSTSDSTSTSMPMDSKEMHHRSHHASQQ